MKKLVYFVQAVSVFAILWLIFYAGETFFDVVSDLSSEDEKFSDRALYSIFNQLVLLIYTGVCSFVIYKKFPSKLLCFSFLPIAACAYFFCQFAVEGIAGYNSENTVIQDLLVGLFLYALGISFNYRAILKSA